MTYCTNYEIWIQKSKALLKFSLREIAEQVGGRVIGDPSLDITGVSEIQASIPGTITFLGNLKYKKYLSDTKASAVFVNNKKYLIVSNGILVKNPQLAMAKTLKLFFSEVKPKPYTHEKAFIDPNAVVETDVIIEQGVVLESGVTIGDGSWIRAHSFIGKNTKIGKNSRLAPNVTIYNDTQIGNNVIIHSGTVIGNDGFGFVTQKSVHEKIPQTGNVIIGNKVEIGSNCSIDRGTIGNTIINEMTKIDNLVHIAHNVTVGKGCLLTAGLAVAGSAEIGDYCTFAGQCGVAPHVKIGSNSTFAAKSGITKSLEGGKIYAGYPAKEIQDHNKREALISEIGRMREKIDRLIMKQQED